MDNLEELDKFLEMCDLPKLNQEEIESINIPLTSNEIESVIRKCPANVQSQFTSQMHFTKHFKKI